MDLSNIIKDHALSPGEDHLVSSTITKLKEIANGDCLLDDLLPELEVLKVVYSVVEF